MKLQTFWGFYFLATHAVAKHLFLLQYKKQKLECLNGNEDKKKKSEQSKKKSLFFHCRKIKLHVWKSQIP